MIRKISNSIFLFVSLSLLILSPLASAELTNPCKIATASIQELLSMTVTSVSNVPEDLRTTSAPVGVITGEEIRRGGATSVPEALRRIPGVNVARIDGNKWAVSIRGFNGRSANKLLVMVDGRSIYDPLFSGTLWETKDIPLEDIERIEVVRGPGGSTWGANAMNGVINIITKNSKETQGNVISAGGGTEERAFTDVRNGGKISDNTFYRVYGRYFNRDNSYPDSATSDDSHNGQGGFRLDGKPDDQQTFMLSGNIYQGAHDGARGMFDDVHGEGGFLQGKWDYKLSSRSKYKINAYYDHTDLDASIITENRNTGEIDLQNDYSLLSWVDVISSLQYRYTEDSINNSQIVAVEPQDRGDSLVSGSVSGKMKLIKDVLDMRTGVKLEHNDYSDFEVQPDVGLTWTISPTYTFWTSVSRAVRTPSRLENDFLITFPDPDTVIFTGNRSLDSETLVSYQAGLRSVLSEDMLISTNFFYNHYDDLIITRGNTIVNGAKGDSYGTEAGIRWMVNSSWTLTSGYSLLLMDVDADEDLPADEVQANLLEGNSPEHQVYSTSRFQINEDWQFDVNLRYVDSLKEPHVDSYIVADARVGYRIMEGLDFSVVGQNLFDRHHFEQGSASATEVQQGVYGKFTWRY